MNYPNRKAVVDSLLNAARVAADNCSSGHPEDIGYAMSFAIEAAAPAVQRFWAGTLPADPHGAPDEMGG